MKDLRIIDITVFIVFSIMTIARYSLYPRSASIYIFDQ